MERTHALAYLRTSSATNVGGDSDVRQRAAIAAYASTHNVEIVGEYYDCAVSGADPVETRPGFAEMLDRIEGNGVRLVIVEDASRFARDLVAQELGVLLMQRRSVRLVTASGDDLTDSKDPTRIMMRQIAGAFAEYEKARLVSKLSAARSRKSAEIGRRIEGRKGFAGHQPKIFTTLAVLRRHNPIATLRDLADQLAEHGFVTSSGKTFAPNQIRRLLSRMPL